MTALRAQSRRSGLELDAPRNGRAADCYTVAVTAGVLHGRRKPSAEDGMGGLSYVSAARHATVLHMISGRLHRISERNCNFSMTCPVCSGEGHHSPARRPDSQEKAESVCKACAGRGSTTGRTEARLEQQAREIAEHYGCRAYFQGDPRGCSLYLVPLEIIPANVRADSLFQAKVYETWTAEHLRDEWISANYNRGHAVVRLGR